jgi:Ca2+-binding RTX toxin-like protein
MPRTRSTLTAVAVAVAAAALVPAAASAATVEVESGRVVLRAAPNERNEVTVSTLFGAIFVRDDAAQLFAGAGCARQDSGVVACRGASTARLELGDGGDTAISGVAADIRGGAGNDVITGSARSDALDGGDGADRIDGGLGADTINGGAGTDTVLYSTRAARVFVDLDGAADDGQAGEGDRVATDVESMVGSSHDDTLVGNAANNSIQGGPGRDQLFGQDGFDTLDGGTGADTLSGGNDVDTITYESRTALVSVNLGDGLANDGQAGEGDNPAGVEKVVGGRGNDVLIGNLGDNILEGGPGNDDLRGSDGNDLLRGGDGSDNLIGNSGSDTLDGQLGADNLTGGDGPGIDRVIYPRLNAVTVTIDDVANDGEFAEGDNVRTDNEQVEGSIAGDTLSGSDNGETLLGGLGNDTLDGRGGADVLDGSTGEDTLRARDGVADQVNCGSGTQDIAVIDADLEVPVACEDVL